MKQEWERCWRWLSSATHRHSWLSGRKAGSWVPRAECLSISADRPSFNWPPLCPPWHVVYTARNVYLKCGHSTADWLAVLLCWEPTKSAEFIFNNSIIAATLYTFLTGRVNQKSVGNCRTSCYSTNHRVDRMMGGEWKDEVFGWGFMFIYTRHLINQI